MGFVNAETIDGWFGDDTYDWVIELQRRMRLERRRYDGFIKRNVGIYDGGLYLRLDLFERINADVEDAFKRVANGERVDRAQFKDVVELFELANETVEREANLLEAIFFAGLVSGIRILLQKFPRRELAAELTEYEKNLQRLQSALARAKREKTEAYFDKAIDAAQLVVTFAFPEIALAKEIAMGLGGLLADSVLGPDDPDASKIARTSASSLKEPIAKVMKFSKSMDKVAGVTSKLNAIYDTVNWDELNSADDNIKAIKDLITKEKDLHKRTIELIWYKWRLRIINFQRQLEKIQEEIEASQKDVWLHQEILADEQKAIKYNPPIAWKMEAK